MLHKNDDFYLFTSVAYALSTFYYTYYQGVNSSQSVLADTIAVTLRTIYN